MFPRFSLITGLCVAGLLSIAPKAIANEPPSAECSGGACLGGQESLNANSSGSSARATSSSAGTTINQQHNTQYNNDAFYGFGSGIQCPTTGLGVSVYGGMGNGSGASNAVSSNSFGGMVTLNVPLGGRNAGTCSELGTAQLEAVQARAEREALEAAKIRTDIYLVTIQQCINILQSATLSGQFADACQGVDLRGVQAALPVPPAVRAPQENPVQHPVPTGKLIHGQLLSPSSPGLAQHSAETVSYPTPGVLPVSQPAAAPAVTPPPTSGSAAAGRPGLPAIAQSNRVVGHNLPSIAGGK